MRNYPLEHDEQVSLFHWVALKSGRYAELNLLHAIPNGGHRNIVVARKMKAEGVKPGIPDMFLPVARQGFHGLYVEMKAQSSRPKRGGKGGLSPEQEKWIRRLRAQGYRVEVCYGWKEAAAVLEDYLQN